MGEDEIPKCKIYINGVEINRNKMFPTAIWHVPRRLYQRKHNFKYRWRCRVAQVNLVLGKKQIESYAKRLRRR